MQLEIHSVTRATASAWDQFVNNHPCGTVYHSSAWLFAVGEAMQQDVRIVAVSRNGRILGGVTFCERRKWCVCIARKPWATAYGGVLVDPTLDPDQQNHIRSMIDKDVLGRYVHVRLEHYPGAPDAPESPAWNVSHKHTFRLDLKDATVLRTNFRGNVRRQINKAERCGVSVARSDDTGAFYELYRSTYNRQGITLPFGNSALKAIHHELRAVGRSRIYLAHDGEEHTAGAMITWDDRLVHYTLAGSLQTKRNNGSMSLVLWTIFKDFEGCGKTFDFIGANSSVPGITRFKECFNPRLVAYPVHTRWRLPLCSLLES